MKFSVCVTVDKAANVFYAHALIAPGLNAVGVHFACSHNILCPSVVWHIKKCGLSPPPAREVFQPPTLPSSPGRSPPLRRAEGCRTWCTLVVLGCGPCQNRCPATNQSSRADRPSPDGERRRRTGAGGANSITPGQQQQQL